jgi:hypothetical protein
VKKISKSIIVLITGLSVTLFAAAQQRTWYAGLHLNPGTYQLYNKNDWNADRILIYPVTGKVNSLTIGVTGNYIWSKHFGASTGLLYNRCKQEFLAEKQPDSPDPIFYYGITNEFNYLKLPVNFEYSTNNQAKHQFVVAVGIQASFLLNYKERSLQKSTGFYSEALYTNKTGKDIDTPTNSEVKYSAFWYNRFLIGANIHIGYRLQIKDGWLFNLGINGLYDITNSENRSARNISNNANVWTYALKRYGYGGPISNRPKTHNRSLGAFISASIPVSVR